VKRISVWKIHAAAADGLCSREMRFPLPEIFSELGEQQRSLHGLTQGGVQRLFLVGASRGKSREMELLPNAIYEAFPSTKF